MFEARGLFGALEQSLQLSIRTEPKTKKNSLAMVDVLRQLKNSVEAAAVLLIQRHKHVEFANPKSKQAGSQNSQIGFGSATPRLKEEMNEDVDAETIDSVVYKNKLKSGCTGADRDDNSDSSCETTIEKCLVKLKKISDIYHRLQFSPGAHQSDQDESENVRLHSNTCLEKPEKTEKPGSDQSTPPIMPDSQDKEKEQPRHPVLSEVSQKPLNDTLTLIKVFSKAAKHLQNPDVIAQLKSQELQSKWRQLEELLTNVLTTVVELHQNHQNNSNNSNNPGHNNMNEGSESSRLEKQQGDNLNFSKAPSFSFGRGRSAKAKDRGGNIYIYIYITSLCYV